jgi:uncharacterized protein (TIGR02391 family)
MFSIGGSVRLADLAGIQYVGNGYSQSCLNAVRRLLQYREQIEQVWILTHGGSHGLLLHIEREGLIAVKAGFASGYGGEGPRTFADVLELLDAAGVSIDEYEIEAPAMQRLEASALTTNDIEALEAKRPVMPRRWHEYIWVYRQGRRQDPIPLLLFVPVMPWALIDPRLTDLALAFFDNPDDAILKGFRRLEDSVRSRTGLTEHGSKLFAQAFSRDQAPLSWALPDPTEQSGRAQLFAGAFMAFRNPRAHREEQTTDFATPLREFLVLNELFRLEGEAVVKVNKLADPTNARR